MTKDSNSKRSSNMSSSMRLTQDPIDLELSELAKRSFNSPQSPNNDVTIGKNGSTEQLVDDDNEDSMFLYGSTAEENNNGNHQHYDNISAMSPDQCRNEEENVIDILANVTDGSKAYDDTEHMVSRQEDRYGANFFVFACL